MDQTTTGNQVYSNEKPSLSPTENRQELSNLAQQSQSVLFNFSSIFPLDLFPDHISIDENKVSIIHRNFFGIANVHSLLISDITDITVDTFFFCAAITIITSSNYRFPITVSTNFVRIDDALKARNLIQGLIATQRKQIDLKNVPTQIVRNEVEKAGKIYGR